MTEENKNTYKQCAIQNVSVCDYYASQAMVAVMGESQEMRIATFWDWVKFLAQTYFHFSFLTVKYKPVENVYKEAAERCYDYADAMMKTRAKQNVVLDSVTGKYDMSTNNEISLVNQVDENYTEFKQDNDKITFDINGKTIVEIRADGECYKNGELITNDIEVFEHLKVFAKQFNSNCT